MTISFSGLASGLDTSSWVESLVALKQAKVETLEEEKENVLSLQETLGNIKSFFSSFRSMIEKVTDAKFGVASMDLFAQNLATSSNLDILTASVTPEAEEAEYNVLVDKLATETSAMSNYSYMTTIIQTTTATMDSKLINLGVNAGNIGVNVNGVERGITITENDTIATFIEKLKNIGVEASYNEETGVFSMNIDDGDINDIDGTGIVQALHLEGVNEGYTSNNLQTSKTDTVYSAATEATLMSELGVQAGVITVHANDADYDITISDTSTLGSFIADLKANNIDAVLDATGVFTISDAEITSEGSTNILDALGLAVDIYGKTQSTADLSHVTVVTQVTAATSSTLLKDLGDGVNITDGQTVIVKNSNNEYTTITVGTTTTLGELLQDMSNAGLYAALNSDGTVEIAGGTIEGGTFDAIDALGLEREPYTAMVNGKPLTETVEVHEIVTLQTRLVDDLKVKEGYLEVTDADGNKFYEKIYSGQTIGDFMTDMGNLGIATSLDEETGILTITGGAFKTLSDVDVQALVNDGTIRETEARYIQGTNLLECLYGSGTISTDHITVASTYSKTQALRHTVTNTINASLTTTLENLGLVADGTAVFDVRGESRTVNLSQTMTIQDLMDALADEGIGSSWDSDNSRITIENAVLTGGTSNLADVLNLTTTISGKYVTSNELYSKTTVSIDATRDTMLSEYGILDSMSEAERTVNLYNSDGTLVGTTVVGEGTTIGNMLDWINSSSDVTASLQDGFLTVNNGYIENAALETSMGLETSSLSSYVLGSVMTVTTSAAVTGETTLGTIISTLGTTNEVQSGYTLNFNGTDLAVSASTTINELINMIYSNGGTASLDHTGRLSINGGVLTGTVAEALGMQSITNTSSVSATGDTLYTTDEVYADRDTTFGELGLALPSGGMAAILAAQIYNAQGEEISRFVISAGNTIGDFFDRLEANGIYATIADGVITLNSPDGNYVTGQITDFLGIEPVTTTEIVNTTQSSTVGITYTDTVFADEDTLLSALSQNSMQTALTINVCGQNGGSIVARERFIFADNPTIGDFFDVLEAYGIKGTITNGVISLYSESGNHIRGADNYSIEYLADIGITPAYDIDGTYTVGQTVSSSIAVTYTSEVVATLDTTLKDLGITNPHLINQVTSIIEPSGTDIAVTNATELHDALTNATAGQRVVLMNDIDLSGYNWTSIGQFQGVLEGNGYTVSNYTADNTGYTNFFGVTNGAEIKNVAFTNFSIMTSSTYSSSAFIGSAQDTTIENVYIGGNMSSRLFNGIIDYASNTDFKDVVIDFDTVSRDLNGYFVNTYNGGNIDNVYIGGESIGYSFGMIQNGSNLTIKDLHTSFKANGGGYLFSGTSSFTNTTWISAYYDSSIASDYNLLIDDDASSLSGLIGNAIVGTGTIGSTSQLAIVGNNGDLIAEINLTPDSTIGDIFTELAKYDIQGSLSNGVITLFSPNGNYVTGIVAKQLGIDVISKGSYTVTTAQTATSTIAITYTETVQATGTTTLQELQYGAINGSISASGVTGDIIAISTLEELQWLRNQVNAGNNMAGKTFILQNNISLTSVSDWVAIGSSSSRSFAGTFDGGGYTISYMKQNIGSGETYGGLFGNVQGGTIKNLTMSYSTITINTTSTADVGLVAGHLGNNSSVSGVFAQYSRINSTSNSQIEIGGIAGSIEDSEISNSYFRYATISVIATSTSSNVGGITGFAEGNSTISEVYNSAYLSGNAYSYGGIVGYADLTNGIININNAYNTGNIAQNRTSTTGSAGGLVGYMTSTNSGTANILNSYSNVTVNSNKNIGAIIGQTFTRMSNVTLNVNRTYSTDSHNLIGYNEGSFAINQSTSTTGISTTEFVSFAQTYWDDEIWNFSSSSSAPTLKLTNDYSFIVNRSDGRSYTTITLGAGTTIDNLVGRLNSYTQAEFADGVISVEPGSNRYYITGALADSVGIDTVSNTVGMTATSSTAVRYTETLVADMSTTLLSTKYKIDGSITASGVTGTVIGIGTATELQYLANLVNSGQSMAGKTFVLTNDINLSGRSWKGIGTGSRSFQGDFDGAGYTISNMTINVSSSSDNYNGLFGIVDNSEIKNVRINNATINITSDSVSLGHVAGFLAARAMNSTIEGITISNARYNGRSISGTYRAIGGVVGSLINGTVSNAKTTAITVSNSCTVGGIVGAANSNYSNVTSLVEKSYSSLVTSGDEIYIQGGIVGGTASKGSSSNNFLTISNCQFDGNLGSDDSYGGSIGGVAYSAGILGYFQVIDGKNVSVAIRNNYVSGTVGQANDASALFVTGTGLHATSGYSNNQVALLFNFYRSQTVTDLYDTTSGVVNVSAINNSRDTYFTTNASVYGFAVDYWDYSAKSLKVTDDYTIYVTNASGGRVVDSYTYNGSNTIGDVVYDLNNNGNAAFVNGQLNFSSSSNYYLLGGLSSLEDGGVNEYNYTTISDDTLLADLGVSSSNTIVLSSNGVTYTVTVTNTQTVGSMLTQLAGFGISGKVDDGQLVLTGTSEAYIRSMSYSLYNTFEIRIGNGYTYTMQSSNTDSDELFGIEFGNANLDTTFGSITGTNERGSIDFVENGEAKTLYINASDTLGDIISALESHGINADIMASSRLTIGSVNDSSYITNISQNVADAFRIDKNTDFYEEHERENFANTDSNRFAEEKETTMTTSTTFEDLGVTSNGYITVVTNGTEHVITVTPDKTVDDIISTIAGYGISADVQDGKITFTANNGCYIKEMSDNIENALNITTGDGNSWISEIRGGWVNTDSNELTEEKTDLVVRGDTVLSSINGFNNGNGNLVVHKTDGTFVTIQVDETQTVDEFFKQISQYGLIGTIDSQGKATITGVGNVYLQAVAGGSNILSAMNLSNLIENVQTVTVNRTSDTLKHTVTVAATGTTTLENLMQSGGGTLTFPPSDAVEMVLDTYSDAGEQHVTLRFSRTQSLYDVIDTLASYGINASIDAMGRFSVTSSSLNDFDISGYLGEFLMGNYTKEYGTDTTYNVSTNLVQMTITNMTDNSLLSEFGVTGGNIVITQQGVNYTINIDTTNIVTVGDFRNLLAQYGFSTSIDDMGRLSVSGIGESYLSTITGGSNILEIFGLEDWTLGEITQKSDHLGDTEERIVRISMSDRLSELTDASGVNLGITAGQIYVYQDGTRSTLNIDTNDTLETLAAKLSQYGITVGISQEGRLYFDGDNDSYLTTDGITTANASNILEKIGISGNWSTRYDSTSDNLNYEEDSNNVVNGSTKLSELTDEAGNNLGITEGTYYIYSNGVRNTETITADTTVNDFMATMAKYGLIADIAEDGSISVGAYNNTYLATSALAGQNSNVVSTLFAEWDFVNIYTSNGLDIPKDEVRAINRDTKLADINEGVYEDGYITVIKDGVQTNISLAADDTVGTLMDELALYGFESVINENGQLIIKNTGDSLLQNYTGSDKASNALELLGIGLNDWITTNTYKSSTIDVVETSTMDVAATRDTLLSELGVTTGEYYIYNNGVRYTALISSDETLGSLMDTLKSFGLETSLVEGPNGAVLSVVGKGDSYVAKSNSTTNASNVVEQLFTNGITETKEYTGLEQTSELVTTYSAATEDTLLSYFDNGLLLSEGDLSVTVNGETSTIKITADETIGSLLQKFRDLGLEATLSDGQIMIQSGYDTFTINTDGTTSNLPATVGLVYHNDLGGYVSSNDTVKATTTSIEEKTLSVANYADGSTQMGLLNISDGSLSVYRNGEKATIQINSNETFDDLKARLATAFSDLDLKFENGYLTIYSKDGNQVEIGSTTDTSNFSAITGIAKDENGNVVSSRELYRVNADSVLTDAGLFRNGQITEGTFVVGDATFTITSTTRLSDIISQINSNDAANATAYWDNIQGKFVIKSRTTGSALINIEAGTSNFTDIMGFTSSEWNADGSVDVTRMNVDSQTIGENARVSINGTTYTSTSNTITSDISRIKGLTINLKGLTEGSAVTLTVERDKETLANAISDVVDSYNELMKNVDEAISKEGDLHSETTLKLIRNQLRNLMTSSDMGTTVFRNLDAIGVSVDSASANNISTSNESIIALTFDKDKFIEAYEADEDAVKDLLIGGANNTGIFTKVETLVESALQSVSGYFAVTENSYQSEIQNLDRKIVKANEDIERYRARLEAKFSAMDLLIAQMQQQYSSFLIT